MAHITAIEIRDLRIDMFRLTRLFRLCEPLFFFYRTVTHAGYNPSLRFFDAAATPHVAPIDCRSLAFRATGALLKGSTTVATIQLVFHGRRVSPGRRRRDVCAAIPPNQDAALTGLVYFFAESADSGQIGS